MLKVHSLEKIIDGIIGKKTVKEEVSYRLSQFVISYETEKECLVMSTFTGRILWLDGAEKEAFLSLKTKGMKGDQLAASGLGKLAEWHMAVPEDYNDCQTYLNVLSIMQGLQKKTTGINEYMILPTLGCNAGCTYCYEEEMRKHVMSVKVADETINFIRRTMTNAPIKIIWYGGEPLTATGTISHICEELSKENIIFSSELVTNGALMNRELAHVVKSEWHVKSVQISADGAREDYEKRKQFHNPQLHNYDSLFHAIHCMLDEGMEVVIRCNYDHENIDRIPMFLRDLHREFPNSKNLTIYFSMLFQARKSMDGAKLFEKACELTRIAKDMNLIHDGEEANNRFRTHYCMADCEDKIIIDPNGKLFHCTNLPKEQCVGTINDLTYSSISLPDARTPDEECRKCPYLPKCTPYYRNLCPDHELCCRSIKEIEFIEKLKKIVKNNKEWRQTNEARKL